MRLPSIFRLYRWRWFIEDMKFRTCMKFLVKRSYFTPTEIGVRKEFANRSILQTWKMKNTK